MISVAVAGVVALAGLVALPTSASAHGTMQDPPSRLYECRFNYEGGGNDLCDRAWRENSQALYDWNGVRVAGATDRPQDFIPDGRLCSANDDTYRFVDEPSADWPATELTPDAAGNYRMTWYSSAPHETDYYRVYVTKPGFDPTEPLAWSDLELIHDSGKTPTGAYTDLDVTLPERTGRHMVYVEWKLPWAEAFYSCSDVVFDGSGSGGAQPTPTPTPSPSPETTVGPTPNPTAQPPSSPTPEVIDGLHVHDTTQGTVQLMWLASDVADATYVVRRDGEIIGDTSATRFLDEGLTPGTDYRYTVTVSTPAGGEQTESDPVLARTDDAEPDEPANPATVQESILSDWGTGYCARGVVTTTSQQPVTWTVPLDVDGRITSSWSGTFSGDHGSVTVAGTWYNTTVVAGGPAEFGYCATR